MPKAKTKASIFRGRVARIVRSFTFLLWKVLRSFTFFSFKGFRCALSAPCGRVANAPFPELGFRWFLAVVGRSAYELDCCLCPGWVAPRFLSTYGVLLLLFKGFRGVLSAPCARVANASFLACLSSDLGGVWLFWDVVPTSFIFVLVQVLKTCYMYEKMLHVWNNFTCVEKMLHMWKIVTYVKKMLQMLSTIFLLDMLSSKLSKGSAAWAVALKSGSAVLCRRPIVSWRGVANSLQPLKASKPLSL